MSSPNPTTKRTVAALDPGRAKCGFAIVSEDGAVVFRAIFPTERVIEETLRLLADFQPVALLVGGGTGSRPLIASLESASLSIPLEIVDESHTSEAARRRYVAENPARGWQRLLPRSLRSPDTPYDDYVAVILAERRWNRA